MTSITSPSRVGLGPSLLTLHRQTPSTAGRLLRRIGVLPPDRGVAHSGRARLSKIAQSSRWLWRDCRDRDPRKRPGTDRSRLARPPQGAPSWSRGPLGPRRHRYAPTARDATRVMLGALQVGGKYEVGEGELIHQRKKPPPSRLGALVRWPRIRPWRVEGTLEGVWRRLRGSWTWERALTTPILSPPSHPVKTVPRASTIGVRAAPGNNPARRASFGRAPSLCLRGIGPAARGPKARGPCL